MGTTVSDSGGDFDLIPEDNHLGRCVQVIDLGTQPGSERFPKPQHKLLLGWELPECTYEHDGHDVPRLVWRRFTASLSEKGHLRPILESWRSRKFTSEELSVFDVKNVLGAPCQIQIVHSDDGKYANVKSVSALHQKLREGFPDAHHPLIHYQIEDGENEIFETFSDNLKRTLRQAEEWQGNEPEGGNPDAWRDGFSDGVDDSSVPF